MNVKFLVLKSIENAHIISECRFSFYDAIEIPLNYKGYFPTDDFKNYFIEEMVKSGLNKEEVSQELSTYFKTIDLNNGNVLANNVYVCAYNNISFMFLPFKVFDQKSNALKFINKE